MDSTVDMNITAIDTASMSLLRLMQLTSPSLPIGAFAYSQGLEQAVELGWVDGEQSAYEWLRGVLSHSISHMEIPLLARSYIAWRDEDLASVSLWNDTLLASRETAELYEEEHLLGRNLARLLLDLGVAEAGEWLSGRQTSLVNMFALASVKWQIPLPMTAQGFAWTWCENQIAAAIKLVPLGQTAGQRLLGEISGHLLDAVAVGLKIDDDICIGQSSIGVALASSWHETQYSRLFRS